MVAEMKTTTRSWRLLSDELGYWAMVAFMVGYIGVLSGAMFYFQFGMGELPCPLCISQRMAMILASFGPLYIIIRALRRDLTFASYQTGLGFTVLGSILGVAMSIRQILLHIAPGDTGYGDAVFGLHLYTWAAISFFVCIAFVGLFLLFGNTFVPVAPVHRVGRVWTYIVIGLFLFTIAANLVVVFAEEGFNWYLPDNPTSYLLFGN